MEKSGIKILGCDMKEININFDDIIEVNILMNLFLKNRPS